MFEDEKQRIRAYAQEFITGTRVDIGGPKAGHALLWLLEQFERHERDIDRLNMLATERAQSLEALIADIEELRDLMERQRQTIEALLEENDALRAKLYLQDRQKPGDASD